MNASEPHNTSNSSLTTDTSDEQVQNPWQEQAEPTHTLVNRLKTPDPRDLQQDLVGNQSSLLLDRSARDREAESQEIRTSADLLEQFDPLANSLEQCARDAWSSTEGHPPQAQSSKDHRNAEISGTRPSAEHRRSVSLTNSSADGANRNNNASPSATFPSLASLAKSLSLSSKARSRSTDSNRAEPNVLSPNTIFSFASQQGEGPSRSPGTGNEPSGEASHRPRDESQNSTNAALPDSVGDNPQFDFQKFLDQMKSRSAEPVAKYLRSFLANFSKRQLTVNEQVKVVNDFLRFIADRMRETDVWRSITDAEFDVALEAMEKLVMNRLYEYTFTPQLAEAVPPRRITTDDLERDRVLGQRIALFGWVKETHLEIPEGPESRGFLMFAQQELLKINHYKAPRDKLICILNCCKVIFGLIRHLHKEENADSFVPILIYVVLQANPPNLLSNIEYINRFRNPEKLQSEAGYYLSSLMGAVSFIETMDHSSLSHLTAEEFERNVEEAISTLPGSPIPLDNKPPSEIPQPPLRNPKPRRDPMPASSPYAGEESAQPLSLSLGQGLTGLSLAEDTTRRFLQRTGDTLSKPLSALGRMLNEVMDGLDKEVPSGQASSSHGGISSYLPGPFAPLEMAKDRERDKDHNVRSSSLPSTAFQGQEGGAQIQTFQAPYKTRVRNMQHGSGLNTPETPISGQSTPEVTPSRPGPVQIPFREPGSLTLPSNFLRASSPAPGIYDSPVRTPSPGLDIPGLQAEIDQAHERAADEALTSLLQMFPSADREVLQWVLEAEQGDLGRSIEKMLEISEST